VARSKYLPDSFTLALLGAVVAATLLPSRGGVAATLDLLTTMAIGLVFFLHGARLSRQAILAGATHWRLHLVVLLSTFVMFPLLGIALHPLLAPLVTPAIYTGVLLLCTLPSTVQSSIALTSLARGNVPAAVCSASASSLIGILLTPTLIGLLIASQGTPDASPWHTIWIIVRQLLLPFVAGQLLRPLLLRPLGKHPRTVKFVDQVSILLVVYTAFSAAVTQGLWHEVPGTALAGLVIVDVVLLVLALSLTGLVARHLGFNEADRITIVFCGSKKSLAAGIPMANVIFAGHAVGTVLLPLMLFHQIQLMTCAVLARRWGARQD
jgi:sodium/bile acid cotransporter 7